MHGSEPRLVKWNRNSPDKRARVWIWGIRLRPRPSDRAGTPSRRTERYGLCATPRRPLTVSIVSEYQLSGCGGERGSVLHKRPRAESQRNRPAAQGRRAPLKGVQISSCRDLRCLWVWAALARADARQGGRKSRAEGRAGQTLNCGFPGKPSPARPFNVIRIRCAHQLQGGKSEQHRRR